LGRDILGRRRRGDRRASAPTGTALARGFEINVNTRRPVMRVVRLQPSMRTLSDLVDRDEPAWPMVLEWIAAAEVTVEVLPVDRRSADDALLATQVTTRSPLGAIVHHSAGIFVDNEWLRFLAAGGHPRFRRSLPSWNDGKAQGIYLVADDVLGGFFALNGGLLGDDIGKVYYYAPDSLQWQPLDLGYSEFFVWAMTGRMSSFYKPYRWGNWWRETRELNGDQAFCIYPFLWAEGPSIGERYRGTMPICESWELQFDTQSHPKG
jgi:hypothetical protein